MLRRTCSQNVKIKLFQNEHVAIGFKKINFNLGYMLEDPANHEAIRCFCHWFVGSYVV